MVALCNQIGAAQVFHRVLQVGIAIQKAIGRALMTNPRLLILDEATEGLAPIVRQEIWSAIATLKRETGLAILLVDKSLAELAQVADRAVILQRGETVWTGGFDALTEKVTTRYIGV